MSFFQDFKKFAFRGNVIDLAVGVVIGGAFGKIVSALVEDVVMPTVALFMPRGDWRSNGWILRHGNDVHDDVVLRYGDLMGSVLDFFIISLVLFVVVTRAMRAAERALLPHDDASPPTNRACPFCLEMLPVKATRCRACTSELPAPPKAAA
jgi:large conductance mechanosensitive channel